MTKRLSEDEKRLRELKRKVLKYEKINNIHYSSLIHPAGKTCEEIAHYYNQSAYANLDYSHCKNLFLVGKAKVGPKKFYLLITDMNTSVDSDSLKETLYLDSLSFASEEEVREVLNGQPGAISLLNLVLIKRGNIQLLVDKNIMKSEFLVFHLLDGRVSQFMSTDDAAKIIEDISPACWEPEAGHKTYIDMPERKISSGLSIADREKDVEVLLESLNMETYSWAFEKESPIHVPFRHMMLQDDENTYMLALPNNKSVDFDGLIKALFERGLTQHLSRLKKLSSDEIIKILGISQKNMSLLSVRNNKNVKLIVDSTLESEYEYLTLYADTNELACSLPSRYLCNVLDVLGRERCFTMNIPGNTINLEDREKINEAAKVKKEKAKEKTKVVN